MASGRLGNQKTLVFHWFFKVLEGRRREADEKKINNSFGDGLREPKPSFSFVFSRIPWLGGRLESPKPSFSFVFQGFGGEQARGRRKQK